MALRHHNGNLKPGDGPITKLTARQHWTCTI